MSRWRASNTRLRGFNAARGCPALQITLPSDFKPDDAADHHRPPPALFSFDPNYETNWNVPFVNSLVDTAGQQCLYTGTPVSCLTP